MCALLPVSVRPRGTQLLSQYSWRIFLGVKMQQYVAFALSDNFQTAGSRADCGLEALDPISDRRGIVGHERGLHHDDTSIVESDEPQSCLR